MINSPWYEDMEEFYTARIDIDDSEVSFHQYKVFAWGHDSNSRIYPSTHGLQIILF